MSLPFFILGLIVFLWTLPFVQSFYWLAEWGQMLTPYVPLLLLPGLFYARKRKTTFVLQCALVAYSGLRLVDFTKPPVSRTVSDSFCVITANLLTQNPTPELAEATLEEFLCVDKPNVVVAIEVSEEWVSKHLKKLEARVPLISARPREDNFGMAVYSQIPMAQFEWLNIGSQTEFPAFHGVFPKGNKVFSFYSVHIMPPLSASKAAMGKENRELFFQIYDQDRVASKIVVGDFNATPGSWALRQFQDRQLKLASNGHYLDFTWKQLPLPWAWFDHVLLTNDLEATQIKTSKAFGSDHRMIKAHIGW